MRRREAPKREILPDPKYKSKLVAKFINAIMVDGKKSTAERTVYGAMEIADKKLKDVEITAPSAARGRDAERAPDAEQVQYPRQVKILANAFNKVRPYVEVKSRRLGGATYQVPVEVRGARGDSLSKRWVKEAAAKRGEKTMAERLAAEIVDIHHDRGAALKKREDTHRMAHANKAFAHYRW